MNDNIKNLKDAENYLFNTIYLNKHEKNIGIQKSRKFAKSIRKKYKEKYIWQHIDKQNYIKNKNPKIVHIAGTSGKGSTAIILSKLLVSQGFKVGLNISPHLFDIRERFQINNKLISEKLFLKYLNDLKPIIEQFKKNNISLTYFEILTILSIYIFDLENVDYVILETGLGGLYDISNLMENKVCILTKIGIDHTKILGKTLSKIAFQKVGIIKKDNLTISCKQKPKVEAIIKEKAYQENANLFIAHKIIPRYLRNTFKFNFKFKNMYINNIELGLHGIHQVENCNLALISLKLISDRDKFILNIDNIRNTLKEIKLPARIEIKKINHKMIIIDAAHNSDKMKNLILSIKKIYPNQKLNFLIAFREIKYYTKMLEYILDIADNIFITQFSIDELKFKSLSVDPLSIKEKLNSIILKKNLKQIFKIHVIKDYKTALKQALVSNKLVITGSFYLISKLYDEIP
ncbi:MAG: hypothetical protein GY830_05085 [Bacteroidetes bacterium]|nr:hypothetical protein [Bacteroidota bacterium]